VRSLNHIVEQDHRTVKLVIRPMLGFKSFEAAHPTLVDIKLRHMLRKEQLEGGPEQALTTAEQFYSMAA
jgi:putative transposase